MVPENEAQSASAVNPWTGADVAAILRERGWLGDAADPELDAWIADAAGLLGTHATDPRALEELLRLIFHYDARGNLADAENRTVVTRVGAREVIRELANRVLDGGGIDSDRFKEIIGGMKEMMRYRGRELFHPIRLALAGRAGEGELDRVILLLDRAAKLPFAVTVKGTRQRMIEFCAAVD